MTQENQLTWSEAIEYLANRLDTPFSLAEFTERVLTIWSSKAKNPGPAFARIFARTIKEVR